MAGGTHFRLCVSEKGPLHELGASGVANSSPSSGECLCVCGSSRVIECT